jgi:hypothetical protein
MPRLAFGSRPSGKHLTALPAAREALSEIHSLTRRRSIREGPGRFLGMKGHDHLNTGDSP